MDRKKCLSNNLLIVHRKYSFVLFCVKLINTSGAPEFLSLLLVISSISDICVKKRFYHTFYDILHHCVWKRCESNEGQKTFGSKSRCFSSRVEEMLPHT